MRAGMAQSMSEFDAGSCWGGDRKESSSAAASRALTLDCECCWALAHSLAVPLVWQPTAWPLVTGPPGPCEHSSRVPPPREDASADASPARRREP
jgi:hypothetical protein